MCPLILGRDSVEWRARCNFRVPPTLTFLYEYTTEIECELLIAK